MKLLPLVLSVFFLPHLKVLGGDPHVEGEVLVTFKQNLAPAAANASLARQSLRMAENYDRISSHSHRLTGLIRGKNRSTAQLIATLKADPDVETVEPNYIRRISSVVPNDPDFPKLWGFQNTGQNVNSTAGTSGVDTRFVTAWRLARAPAGEIVVGVIDTGMDITHPDLVANLWSNPGEIPGNGIDDDADGYIDDTHGYDFTGGTAVMTDSGEHGTHVAGTIGAVGKNSAGVIGVAFRAKVLPMKVSSDGNTITTSAALSAYNYAVVLKQKGINLVALNASFGGSSSSVTEQTAIAALRDAGIILCAAAGNESANNDSIPSYPASYPTANIISVAALTQANGLAGFSNYGATSVDIAAPGVNIYSTKPVANFARTVTATAGAASYAAREIQFAGTTSLTGLTQPIISCGIGNTGQFPPAVSGKIALIQRGSITFEAKITNAMNAGALAAIVYDNTTDALGTGGWTLNTTTTSWIPALRVTKSTGEAILAALPVSGTVVNFVDPSLVYQFLDGTSMATPHVAGAVAFAALNFPSESMSQRILRILNHATAVSALTGKMTTVGRLDLLKIVDTDGDGLPDWWENENFGNLAQTATGDPDGDGFSNLEEFLSRTSPMIVGSHLAFSGIARGAGASANNFTLSFPTVEDTGYRVDESGDLSSWTPLGAAVTGTGSTIQVIDTNALNSAAKKFYRLSLIPE